MDLRFAESFYNLLQWDERRVRVAFDARHLVYALHFPTMPITPGCLLIQCAKELFEQWCGKSLHITKIRNAKFLAILNPKENPVVWFDFVRIDSCGKGWMFEVQVYSPSRETVFAKISMEVV